ncbi:TraR/DksA family transcriptional regulator [Silvibacterium dinghuense]|uniref:TraR/DksA family transcriptional regulator n=1 Tax=Silvibacterium dinghuense TaxID=1560006 RepID=A0A4Q1SL38_9BACT|nr:TraR/DksA family transcriptional regulator [Silvibacterium dinghuense]
MPNNPNRLYEEKLQQQKRTLESSLRATVRQGRQSGAEETLDPADQAVFSYEKELLFSQGATGHAQLNLIRQALLRIEDGSFGECQHCGERIGSKRLEAVPWSRFCIGCQERVERGELDDSVQAA